MNHDTIQYAAGLVEANYLSQGAEHLSQFSTAIKTLFAQRKIPQDGLSPLCIELFLQQLSLMDTNNGANATTNVGAGEREGRVLSQLVKKRHYHFSHGIGRSGDLNVSQPKAAGSSLLYQVCNFLVLHFIQLAGAPSTQSSILFPMATGMTLALVLRTLAKKRNQEYLQHHKNNENNNPSSVVKYVIWPRIDQKTALKCIDVAGLTPVVVEPRPAPFLPDILRQHENENNKQHPFLLQCAVEDIESIILNTIKDPNLIVCVLSTTSCFAPRLPDDIIGISKLCWQYNIPHVVNNAYGLQCRPSIMQKMEYIHHQYRNSLKKMHEAWQKMINKNEKGEMEEAELLKPIKEIKESITNGMRLDVFVQSTDKNLLVPVGGALIASCLPQKFSQPPNRNQTINFETQILQKHFSVYNNICGEVSAMYAGRASAAPVLDVVLTLLEVGVRGFQRLWQEREVLFLKLQKELRIFAEERGEVLVEENMWHYNPETNKNENINPNNEKNRNEISMAITMQHYRDPKLKKDDNNNMNENNFEDVKSFGGKLFRGGVTGPRVILPIHKNNNHHHKPPTVIAGQTFYNYGTHQNCSGRSVPMLVMACGVGMNEEEGSILMSRLRELWPVREEH